MMQCTKEDSGARLVNPWIMGKKRTFTVLGTFFFCPTFFFFFLGAWLVDKQYVLDTFFSISLCGILSVLHRKAVCVVKYCNIYSAQESHKRNTLPGVQKSFGCVTSWKRGGLWCHEQFV